MGPLAVASLSADALLQGQPVSDWAFVVENADYLLLGAVVTVLLTATAVVLGLLAGFPAGAIEVYGSGPLRSLVSGAGVLLRGTPIVVILVFMFFAAPFPLPEGNLSFTVPGLGPLTIGLSAFTAATIGLGLRSAAYQAQIFRGALQSVSEGQMEAARAVGLSKLEAIRYVILPQALRRSIPGFQNEFTIVLKDTSVAFAIGLTELLSRSEDLFVESTTAILEVILFISVVYFVLTFATNRTLDAIGRHYAVPGGDR
ncbi:amino acid ABC transporter permease [Halomarina litorea]|uniref:amino acid ABC transporter permease n=1 Tax=Halomarina litorea TaxID=2961595 RepID=UPI0020C2BC5E|nr:amino acid ABC transporter permease [Halomarina sp. BCD28]